MPIRGGDVVHALISISFFTTAIPKAEIAERIVAPLRATTARIEDAFALMSSGSAARAETPATIELGF
jgi:hypothetical protein